MRIAGGHGNVLPTVATTPLDLEFPAEPGAVAAARRALEQIAQLRRDEDALAAARLLVSELVSNAVEHGPRDEDATVRLCVEERGPRVRISVWDGGDSFRLPPSRPSATDSESGRGLALVRAHAARVGYEVEDGVRIWFELELATPTGQESPVPPSPQ